MSTFREYINEASKGTTGIEYPMPRSKEIGYNQFKKLVETNCKKSIGSNKGELWRETKFGGEFMLSDPSVGVRLSRTYSNYITLLMDNLPMWKGWPKRSKSLICATSEGQAFGWGTGNKPTRYIVIPYDSCKIGICRTSDIVTSFSELGSIITLVESIDDIFKKYDIKVDDTSWDSTRKGLERLAREYKVRMHSTFKGRPATIWHIIEKWNIEKGSFIDFLDKLLAPRKNGFKLYRAGSLPKTAIYEGVEAWVGEGKCLLVSNKAADIPKVRKVLGYE